VRTPFVVVLAITALVGTVVSTGGITSAHEVTSKSATVGLPSPSQFIAEYDERGPSVVFEVLSLDTGAPIGEIAGSPVGPNAPTGPWRADDGSIWYSEAAGPSCTNPGGLECESFVPDSCSGTIFRLDPMTGANTVLLRAASSVEIGGAVPAPNEDAVAYLQGGCTTSYLNEHIEIEHLRSAAKVSIGAGLRACHFLSEPSFSANGSEVAFVYGPSLLPSHSTFTPNPTDCLAPGEGELVVASALRSSGPSSWRVVHAAPGCGFSATVFDLWGVAAVEACGQNGLGNARLLQFDRSLRVAASYPLAPGSNGTTLAVNAARSRVLIDEYETTGGDTVTSGPTPGGLRPGPFIWIDVFDGRNVTVAHRYRNYIFTVEDATW
jgi:hypothetical protein